VQENRTQDEGLERTEIATQGQETNMRKLQDFGEI